MYEVRTDFPCVDDVINDDYEVEHQSYLEGEDPFTQIVRMNLQHQNQGHQKNRYILDYPRRNECKLVFVLGSIISISILSIAYFRSWYRSSERKPI